MKPIWALLACLVLYVPGFVAVTQPEPQGVEARREGLPLVIQGPKDAPFDVPPVVVDKWDPPLPKPPIGIHNLSDVPCNPSPDTKKDYYLWMCVDGNLHHYIRTKSCSDKTRFLLQSEDGKAHCLKLVPGDAGAVGTSK